jgi:hypothetical protein
MEILLAAMRYGGQIRSFKQDPNTCQIYVIEWLRDMRQSKDFFALGVSQGKMQCRTLDRVVNDAEDIPKDYIKSQDAGKVAVQISHYDPTPDYKKMAQDRRQEFHPGEVGGASPWNPHTVQFYIEGGEMRARKAADVDTMTLQRVTSTDVMVTDNDKWKDQLFSFIYDDPGQAGRYQGRELYYNIAGRGHAVGACTKDDHFYFFDPLVGEMGLFLDPSVVGKMNPPPSKVDDWCDDRAVEAYFEKHLHLSLTRYSPVPNPKVDQV